MAIRDLAGTGVLQESLATTNSLLADVLAQLQETNSRRLEEVAEQLRTVNDKLDRLVAVTEQTDQIQ